MISSNVVNDVAARVFETTRYPRLKATVFIQALVSWAEMVISGRMYGDGYRDIYEQKSAEFSAMYNVIRFNGLESEFFRFREDWRGEFGL